MHLDKKLVTIIVGSALAGGIIGGGIGGAIGSFGGSHMRGERVGGRGGMERGGWQKEVSEEDINETQEDTIPQEEQVTKALQAEPVATSTTQAN